VESEMRKIDAPAWFASYAHIRTDIYIMLASLLGQPPSRDLLDILQNLQWDEAVPKPMDTALEALRQAGRDLSHAALEDEFNRVFVGLGRGVMVPYASWYRERMLQSSTLATLRSDLIGLGIVKQADNCEPEDHAGALCEIMALISREVDGEPYPRQARFFQQHIAPWMPSFFEDLQSAESARFYRLVGIFGSQFLESENEYLQYGATVEAL
jgi:TorA maturation chaperone TorD